MCWLHKLRTKYWNFQYIISYLREERTWGNSPFKNSYAATDTLSHLLWWPKPKWETLKDWLRHFLEKKSHRPCLFTSCLYQKHTMVSKPERSTSFSWVGNDSFASRIYSFKSSDMGNSCNELIYNYFSKFSSLFPLGKMGLSTFQIWCHIISHVTSLYQLLALRWCTDSMNPTVWEGTHSRCSRHGKNGTVLALHVSTLSRW